MSKEEERFSYRPDVFKKEEVYHIVDDLQGLLYNIDDKEVFRVESEYIRKFNSIQNGFNSLISNKKVLSNSGTYSGTLFEQHG